MCSGRMKSMASTLWRSLKNLSKPQRISLIAVAVSVASAAIAMASVINANARSKESDELLARANEIASEANDRLMEANDMAREANRQLLDANEIARQANNLLILSNEPSFTVEFRGWQSATHLKGCRWSDDDVNLYYVIFEACQLANSGLIPVTVREIRSGINPDVDAPLVVRSWLDFFRSRESFESYLGFEGISYNLTQPITAWTFLQPPFVVPPGTSQTHLFYRYVHFTIKSGMPVDLAIEDLLSRSQTDKLTFILSEGAPVEPNVDLQNLWYWSQMPFPKFSRDDLSSCEGRSAIEMEDLMDGAAGTGD